MTTFLFCLVYLTFRKFFNDNMPSFKIVDIKSYLYEANPITLLKWAFQALIIFGIAYLVDLIIDNKATPQTLDMLVRFVFAIGILEAIARICTWTAYKLARILKLS